MKFHSNPTSAAICCVTSVLESSPIKYRLRFSAPWFLASRYQKRVISGITKGLNICIATFAALFLLTACAGHESRQKSANMVAEHSGFKGDVIKAGEFWLQTYQKVSNPALPYTVYIEGDGFAFRDKWHISPDPTPTRPMLLELATQDYRSNVIYIARPCQYEPINMDLHCNNSYWTVKRMSDEVVNSINVAINKLTHNQPVDLIGYSGGGGIAVLIGARNHHIRSIITIAANLDIVAFNQYHNVRPMVGSLNPIDVASKVKNIPQTHYTGGGDTIVPSFIADKFVQAADSSCVKQEIIPDVSHDGNGWKKNWNYILSTPVTCQAK